MLVKIWDVVKDYYTGCCLSKDENKVLCEMRLPVLIFRGIYPLSLYYLYHYQYQPFAEDSSTDSKLFIAIADSIFIFIVGDHRHTVHSHYHDTKDSAFRPGQPVYSTAVLINSWLSQDRMSALLWCLFTCTGACNAGSEMSSIIVPMKCLSMKQQCSPRVP